MSAHRFAPTLPPFLAVPLRFQLRLHAEEEMGLHYCRKRLSIRYSDLNELSLHRGQAIVGRLSSKKGVDCALSL